jgi:peptidoglycan/xylan/chitin deacetylase (PgdA/CDA1 family)
MMKRLFERCRPLSEGVGMTGSRPRITRRGFLGAASSLVVVAACDSSGSNSGLRSTRAPASTPGQMPAPTQAAPTTPTAPPSAAQFVASGSPANSAVALTFHTDGELAIATALLDELWSREIRMTAFIVGAWLDANPSWATLLADAGHELANHTYSHPTFSSLSADAMAEEIARCRDVLVRLTGSGGSFFRPSGTPDGITPPSSTVLEIAGGAGYPVVLGFDVDPIDYDDPGADAVAMRVLASVAPGSVVSLHFGHPGTVTALPTILDGLDERGLTPVTASELLA